MTGQEDTNCRALKVIYRYQLGPADRRGRVGKLTASVDFSLHSQLQPLVGSVKPIQSASRYAEVSHDAKLGSSSTWAGLKRSQKVHIGLKEGVHVLK